MAVAAAIAHLCATIAVGPGGTNVATWTGWAAESFAPVLCLWRALRVPQERTAWLLIGLGLLSFVAGDSYWNLELNELASPPEPSWADAGYLLFYPLAGIGLFLQIRHAAGRFPQGFVLDWIIGGLAIVAIMAATVFPDVLSASGGDFAQVAVNLAYPIGDLLLLALLVGAVQLNGWRPRGVWALFAGGLLLVVAGDSVFLYQAASESYVSDTPLDALWSFGLVAMGLAAGSRRPVGSAVRVGSRLLSRLRCSQAARWRSLSGTASARLPLRR